MEVRAKSNLASMGVAGEFLNLKKAVALICNTKLKFAV